MHKQSKEDRRSLIWAKILLSCRQTFAIVEADMQKLWHDPYELFTRMIQPSLWLLIFGQAMANAGMVTKGEGSYLDYIAPGILAQSVLFIGIFYGIALIWERDMGILNKILVSPAPRWALVVGRAFAAGIRSLSQVFIIYLLCFLLSVHLKWDVFSLLGMMAMVMVGGAVFSTLSLIIASIVKKRERFLGIGQVLTMPLFFASNALYPIETMPGWIQGLSLINPLTYQIDALRHFMIIGQTSRFGLFPDFSLNLFVFIVLVFIATRMYPKILY